MRPLIALLGALWSALALADLATAPVQVKDIPLERAFDGVLEAVKKATVSAQTSGRIQAIFFDVDDYVEKGAVLLRFSDTEQKARVAAAEAALREARVRLKHAEAAYERVRRTYEKKLVAKSELDRARAERDAARERLQAAEAALKAARQELAYTVVRAPYSGIVVARHVEVGELAEPGRPLMTGFSLEALRATAAVPQRFIGAVRRAGAARVEVDGRRLESGRVTVYPYADPASHTFRVRVRLPAGEKGLYPGMYARVVFPVGSRRALLVPRRAVVYRSEVVAAYVVDGEGRVSFRQLRLGPAGPDDTVEVLAGLKAGERVALDPIAAGVRLKAQREARR